MVATLERQVSKVINFDLDHALVLDWERNIDGKPGWYGVGLYGVSYLAKDALLDPLFYESFPEVKCLIIESAHLKAKNGLSLAQVYTLDEVVRLYDIARAHDITIFEFPQSLTFRARAETGHAKKEDAQAIYAYLSKHPEQNLKRSRLPSEDELERWEHWNAMRYDWNEDLNIARVDKYKCSQRELCLLALKEAYPTLTQAQRDLLMEVAHVVTNQDGTISKSKIKTALVVTLWVVMRDRNGDPRFNHWGNVAGIDYMWKAMQLSPYKSRGGVARSNLMFHSLRHFEKAYVNQNHPGLWLRRRVSEDERIRNFSDEALNAQQAARARWRQGIRLLLQIFRDFSIELVED